MCAIREPKKRAIAMEWNTEREREREREAEKEIVSIVGLEIYRTCAEAELCITIKLYTEYVYVYISASGVHIKRWKSHLGCQKLVKYWPFPIGIVVVLVIIISHPCTRARRRYQMRCQNHGPSRMLEMWKRMQQVTSATMMTTTTTTTTPIYNIFLPFIIDPWF